MVTVDFTDELAIIKGDDFSHVFEFQDENCDLIDQSASTFVATLYKNGATLVSFTVVVNVAQVTLSLTDTQTTALTAMKKADYKLKKTTGSETHTIIRGEVDIIA